MKATIERATLLKSLGHVQSVVERRNTIPIRSNVLIEASGDPVSGASGLRLMATDLEPQIVESATAHVDQPGATTVAAHTRCDNVRKLPDGAQVNRKRGAEGKRVSVRVDLVGDGTLKKK